MKQWRHFFLTIPLQKYACKGVFMHMRYKHLILMCNHAYHPLTHTHHIRVHTLPTFPTSPPPASTRARAEWVFLRSAIILSAVCRQRKLLGWHPQHPNPTLPVHPISKGNKAKSFR